MRGLLSGEGARQRAPKSIMKKSLCQTCFNYIGCPWHENFTPRDDWEATPTAIKEHNICEYYVDSYCVNRCPAYKRRPVQSKEIVTIQDIADVLGISWRTATRWIKSGVAEYKLKVRGYALIIDYTKNAKYAVYKLEKLK